MGRAFQVEINYEEIITQQPRGRFGFEQLFQTPVFKQETTRDIPKHKDKPRKRKLRFGILRIN